MFRYTVLCLVVFFYSALLVTAQVDSIISQITSGAASVASDITSGAVSVESAATSGAASVGGDITSVAAGVFETVTSVGGSAVTVITSAGGKGFTLGASGVTNAVGDITSFYQSETAHANAASAVAIFGDVAVPLCASFVTLVAGISVGAWAIL
ncbi:hypothetical protein K439DRAFT_1632515 [Ramaria rubella]|nr:hypothetical protein K439DRAFT_1632515 [Ramaria rubella]